MAVKQNRILFTRMKTHKLISFVSLVGIFFVAWLLFSAYRSHQNKLAFQEARSTIDSIYSDVVLSVGEPDSSKRTSSCSKHFEEWGGGQISCSVDTSFAYGVENRDQATEKYKKIQQVISSHKLLVPNQRLSYSITDELIVNTYYHSADDSYSTQRGLKCVANYYYDTPREIDLKVKNPELKTLQVNTGCFGGAKNLYYPIAN